MKSAGSMDTSSEVYRMSLDISSIYVKSLGRVSGPVGWLRSIWDGSWDQQTGHEVSRTSLDISRIAVEFLGRV